MNTATFKISKEQTKPFIKQGEVIEFNGAGIKKPKYNIVLNDSKDIYDIEDEEFGNAMQSTFTLRPLSHFKLIRKIQVLYYRTKFKIQK